MIRLIRMLCPQRHCILALATEPQRRPAPETPGAATVESAVRRMIAEGLIHPWCGICHAPQETWRVEEQATKYATMQAIRPYMEQLEREQAAARSYVPQYGCAKGK